MAVVTNLVTVCYQSGKGSDLLKMGPEGVSEMCFGLGGKRSGFPAECSFEGASYHNGIAAGEGRIGGGAGNGLTHVNGGGQLSNLFTSLVGKSWCFALQQFGGDCAFNQVASDDDQTNATLGEKVLLRAQGLFPSMFRLGDRCIIGDLLDLAVEMRPVAGDKDDDAA